MALTSLALLSLVTSAQATSMEDVIRKFTEDKQSLERFYDIDPSEARYTRLESFYKDSLALLKLRTDSNSIDGKLHKNYLERQVAKVAFDRRRTHESDAVFPWETPILDLEYRRRAMNPLEPEASALALSQAIKLMQTTSVKSLTPVQAMRATKRVDAIDRALDSWYTSYAGYRPEFSWWCEKPYKQLDEQLKKLKRELREHAGFVGEETPMLGDPIGRNQLLDELKYEMLDESPEDLLQIAEKEFAWCEAEMKKASQAMGFGSDWKKALEAVKQTHVDAGAQDMLMRDLGKEAEEYVEKHDLITVPPLAKETWRLFTMTPDIQKNMPFSGYFGQAIGVSSPHESMDSDIRSMVLRGNNPHFSRAIVGHELIPGHHLQLFMAERHKNYRQLYQTPFFVEGWALHWELLLYEMGFAAKPEDKIGMLFWRMHRCARITVSLKFHLGEMKPSEMIDFLVDRVGHERWTATSEVRRFIGEDYSPLYQCAYMIGGLQLRELYREFVGSKRMSARQFHDTVLQQGAIPMKMVGQALAESLPRG